MWKSTVPKGSHFERGNLVATAVLAGLLSLGLAVNAFGQDDQARRRHRNPVSSPTSNLLRAWEGIWVGDICRRWTINSST